ARAPLSHGNPCVPCSCKSSHSPRPQTRDRKPDGYPPHHPFGKPFVQHRPPRPSLVIPHRRHRGRSQGSSENRTSPGTCCDPRPDKLRMTIIWATLMRDRWSPDRATPSSAPVDGPQSACSHHARPLNSAKRDMTSPSTTRGHPSWLRDDLPTRASGTQPPNVPSTDRLHTATARAL